MTPPNDLPKTPILPLIPKSLITNFKTDSLSWYEEKGSGTPSDLA